MGKGVSHFSESGITSSSPRLSLSLLHDLQEDRAMLRKQMATITIGNLLFMIAFLFKGTIEKFKVKL
jgi:hypothetical protein